MAETIRCERCGDESPTDARFCIDCGAPLAQATTGPTTRLAGMRCPTCGTANPEHARFCVVCGRGLLAGAVPQPRPAPAPNQPPAAFAPTRPSRSAREHSYPRVDSAPVAIPLAPTTTPPRPAARAPQGRTRLQETGPLLFVIGLFLLLMTNSIWPGILWLIAISRVVGAAAAGRTDRVLMSLIWWGGLATLFATGMFWPGILVLLFLSMTFSGRGRHYGRWW